MTTANLADIRDNESPSYRLPWPLRSIIAGAAGTAILTLSYAIEHKLRPSDHGSLDYDDSNIPGAIVANILDLRAATAREEHDLGLLLRWSYGSVFGLLHGALKRLIGEPRATLAFGGTLLGMTFTMFPLLGRTPPPWRWPRGYLLTCLSTHAAYALTVRAVDDKL